MGRRLGTWGTEKENACISVFRFTQFRILPEMELRIAHCYSGSREISAHLAVVLELDNGRELVAAQATFIQHTTDEGQRKGLRLPTRTPTTGSQSVRPVLEGGRHDITTTRRQWHRDDIVISHRTTQTLRQRHYKMIQTDKTGRQWYRETLRHEDRETHQVMIEIQKNLNESVTILPFFVADVLFCFVKINNWSLSKTRRHTETGEH